MKMTWMNRACKGLMAGFLMAAVAGCNDAEFQPIDNAAYIAEAYGAASKLLSFSNDEGAQTTLTARLGDRAAADCSFRFEVAPEVLTRYNQMNGTSYVQLPDGAYNLPADPVSVTAGAASAAPLQVEILPYTQEMKDSGVTYALPVRLLSTDGNMRLLNDLSEFLLICNWQRIVPVPLFNTEFVETGDRLKKNRIMFDMGDADINFTAYTFEFMMYMEDFSTTSNQMLVGLEGSSHSLANRMWVRFENNNPKKWMQINSMVKPAIDASTPNQAKVWQHVAIVFDGSKMHLYLDGTEVATKDAPNSSINFRYFSLLPQPSYFTQTISFREVRLWNVARTAAQLANNATNVDPKSEGLLGYWKMDEGSGYTFNDATGNGHLGTCQYSTASEIGDASWPETFTGPATGLKWVENSEQMDE